MPIVVGISSDIGSRSNRIQVKHYHLAVKGWYSTTNQMYQPVSILAGIQYRYLSIIVKSQSVRDILSNFSIFYCLLKVLPSRCLKFDVLRYRRLWWVQWMKIQYINKGLKSANFSSFWKPTLIYIKNLG